MSSSDVSVTSNSDVVFKYPTEYTFRIKNNNDLPKFSYVNILLPSTVLADTTVYCLYNNLAIGCVYNSISHSIAVDYFSSNIVTANQLNTADFIIGNLYNPTSTKQTASFQF